MTTRIIETEYDRHRLIKYLETQNEAFKAEYDNVIKPLPYEAKLSLMKEPLSWPATSIMTTKQKKTFLDEEYRFYSDQGLLLTDPESLKWEKAA